MNIETQLPEIIIIIEFVLVAVIVLLTYFLKGIYVFRETYNKKLITQIDDYLNNLIASNLPFNKKRFQRQWKKINIIVPIFQDFDTNKNNSSWQKIRNDFIHMVLLPLARDAASSKNWSLRLYASEVFSLDRLEQDDKFITELVKDDVPLVSINASKAAILHNCDEAVNFIITKMASERRLTQAIYMQTFDDAPPKTHAIIDKRLMTEKDPYARAACYNILAKYPPEKISWNMDADLESTNIELRLASIRFITKSKKKAAIPMLINLLDDASWEVQVVVIHCLNDLKAEEAISKLAICLHSLNWWVRLNAAQVLKNFGDSGVKVLKRIDATQDKYAYEMAQHVLKIT